MAYCFSDIIGFLNLGNSSKSPIDDVQFVVDGSQSLPFSSNRTTLKSLSVFEPVLIFSKKLREKKNLNGVIAFDLPRLDRLWIGTGSCSLMVLSTIKDIDNLAVVLVTLISFRELKSHFASII